ncbi:MAG: molybdate ABC transporter substrate-binding protein [Desulforhopalus sp.]|nr:molybdate ABC transporter substrate-binding protein [Desulforhopalus sp.]
MKKTMAILATLLLLIHLAALSVNAGEIHVSAAASLKDAFRDIISGFKQTAPDTVVVTNFGASGALAKQIVQGAPADLFVSADGKWTDYLLQEDKGKAEMHHILAYNSLVFVGKKGLAVGSLADLQGLQRIAIGSPASVPAGAYAMQAMRAAGIYEALETNKKLVMAQDVRQALLYADRGEVDGAMVYRTDALLAEHAAILLTIPANLHDRIAYPMMMTDRGAARAEAKAFFTYLTGPESKSILEKYGFETKPQ